MFHTYEIPYFLRVCFWIIVQSRFSVYCYILASKRIIQSSFAFPPQHCNFYKSLMMIMIMMMNCFCGLVDLLFPVSNQKLYFFRNYKKFDETKFLADLKNTNFSFTSADLNENYLFLTNSFSKIVEKHVPLKKKTLRGNHAPLVSKELRKAINKIGS